MKQISNIKNRIADIYSEILIFDVAEENSFNQFIEGAIAVARLIETVKPDANRKLIERIEKVEYYGNLNMKAELKTKGELLTPIRIRGHNEHVIANGRRRIKSEISKLLQTVITQERILEE